MANRRYIDFPIASSVGDSDIILIWQSGANKQTTKATFLSGLPENLDELNDVAISGLTNGQILRYDSVTGKWENTDQGNLDLNDLNDVSIVSPSNGQVLVYNSSTSKWENSSGGYVPYTGAVTTVNLGAQTIQAGSFVKAGGTAAQFLKANGSVDSNVYGTGTVTSVALTMPTAFTVGGSPITTAGTLAVTGAGTVGQYIRGDGSLADFPESSGGGSSVSYYLNGSVAQGTIGGVAYKELNKIPILGAGTDFTINADGYIASFITDAGDPNLLEIPAGNWNFETYFSASSGGGSPTFYVELYKVNSGGTATLIASNSTFPELIAFGTNVISYFSTLAVPTTALALTDRLAIRYYVTHSGRTIKLHTEDNHLCQIVTTFTTGLTALNGLTAQIQNFAVGTSGTDFAIASATATHTFNLPTASATNRGALSSADWTTFNNKQNALTNPVTGTGVSGRVAYWNGTNSITSDADLLFDGSNLTVGGNVLVGSNQIIGINTADASDTGYLAICGASADGSNRGGHIYLSGNERAGDAGSVVIAGGNTTSGTGAIAAIVFRTLGTDKARFTSAGNFGIGTDTPVTFGTKNLDVNGGAGSAYIVARGLNNAGTVEMAFDGGGYIGTKTAHDLVIRTSDLQRINVFATSGNVLVGTGSDNGAKFQVSGTATISSSLTVDSCAFVGQVPTYGVDFAQFSHTTRAGTNQYSFLSQQNGTTYINSSNSQSIFFRHNNSNLAIITSDGNLTIGTTNSYGKFQTKVATNANFYLTNYNAGEVAIQFTNDANSLQCKAQFYASQFVFTTGNVLINTTNDTGYKLNVAGIQTIGNVSLPFLDFKTTDTVGPGWQYKQISYSDATNTELYNIGYYYPNLQFLVGGTRVATFTSSGKVLINSTDVSTQGEMFFVTATNLAAMFRTTGGAANNWAANFWNNATSGNNLFIEFGTETAFAGRGSVTYNRGSGVVAYNTTSDYRIKTEIQDFNAFNIINNLKPKEFRIGDAKQKSIGFIAHELQEFFSQAVHGEKDAKDSNNKPIYQGVDYSQLTGLLVKAIQELKQEIDTLKN